MISLKLLIQQIPFRKGNNTYSYNWQQLHQDRLNSEQHYQATFWPRGDR